MTTAPSAVSRLSHVYRPLPAQQVRSVAAVAIRRFTEEPRSTLPPFDERELTSPGFQHSVLDKPLSQGKKALDTNVKFFAHIHGGRDISGTTLEGYNRIEVAKFFHRYFSEEAPGLLQPEQVALFQDASLDLTPEALAEKVHRLEAGKGFLFAGGWQGHTILFHFIKLASGHYGIYIYNTGAGIETYHTYLTRDGKTKIRPVVYYHEVTADELCLPTAERLGWLVKLKENKREAGRVEFVYEKIFGHITHKISYPQDALRVATAARSGICAFHAYLPLICNLLGGVEKYKVWHFRFKFETLLAAFDGGIDRLLLGNAARNMHLSAAKLCKKRLIDFTEAQIVSDTCADLEARLEGAQQPEGVQGQEPWPSDIQVESISLEKHLAEAKRGLVRHQVQTFHPETGGRVQFPGLPLAHQLRSFLETYARQISYQYRQGSYHQVCWQVEKLAYALPLDSAYWADIPEAELLPCLRSLHELLEKYILSLEQTLPVTPHYMNVSFSLCAGIHQMALRLDPWLKEYGIDISRFADLANSPACIFVRPQDFERRQALLAHFGKYQVGPLLFKVDYAWRSIPREHVDAWIKNPSSRLPEDLYFSRFLNEKASQRLEENASKWRQENRAPDKEMVRVALLLSDTTSYKNERNEHAYLLQGSLWIASYVIDIRGEKNPVRPSCEFKFELKLQHLIGQQYISIEATRYGHPIFRYSFNFIPLHRHTDSNRLQALIDSDPFQKVKRQYEAYIVKAEGELIQWFSKDGLKQTFALDQKVFPLHQGWLASLQCEPSLQIAKLLHYFAENIALLENPEIQTFFELILFKIEKTPRGQERVLLFEQVARSPALIEKMNEFIALGLNHFYYCKEGKPQVLGALFFVRLAERLKTLSPAAPIMSTAHVLEEWLSQGNFSQEELYAIYLHRGCLAAQALVEEPSDRLLEPLVMGWILSQNLPTHPHWKEVDLAASLRQAMYDYSERIGRFLQRNDRFFNAVLQRLHLQPGAAHENWECVYPHYFIRYGENRFWAIHLETGAIRCEEGGSNKQAADDISKKADYVRLFGEAHFPVQVLHPFIHFLHPQYGRIRIHVPQTSDKKWWDSSPQALFAIQREIEGRWWQYIPTEKFPVEIFPLATITDYSHWTPVDSPENGVIRVFHLRTLQEAFVFRPKEGIFSASGRPLLTAAPLMASLTGFEMESFILIEEENRHVHQIRFHRYKSLGGEPLRFCQEEGSSRLAWAGNPSFHLLYGEGKFSVDGCPHLLLLQNRKGEQKALVPLRPMEERQDFTTEYQIDLQREEYFPSRDREFHRRTEPKKTACEGAFQFVEFDVQDSRLIPLSPEAELYLSYLYLAGRRYAQAVKLLRQFVTSVPLSPQSFEILQHILQAGGQLTDFGPAGAAVRLQAGLLLRMKRDFSPQEFERIRELLQRAAQDYRRSSAKVPGELQLLQAQWETLERQWGTLWLPNETLLRGAHAPREVVCDPRTPLAPLKHFTSPYRFRDIFPSEVDEPREIYDRTNFGITPPRGDFPPYIRTVFGWYYRQAREAASLEERLRIAYLLDAIKTCRPARGEYLPELDKEVEERLYAYLHLALRFPDMAPEIPEGREKRLQWLKEIGSRYRSELWNGRSVKEEPTPAFPPPPPLMEERPPLTLARDLLTRPASPPSLPRLLEQTSSRLQLQALRERYLLEAPLPKEVSEPLTPIGERDLLGGEALFLNALRAAFQDFSEDFRVGQRINQEQFEYRLRSEDALTRMQEELTDLVELQKKRVAQWSSLIVNLANHLPEDRSTQPLLMRGHFMRAIELEECVDHFCNGTSRRLQQTNPSLSTRDIEELMSLVQIYLIEATELQQAKRALKLAKEADIHKLGVELAAAARYNPALRPQMLVFEYRSNLRMRPIQVELIDKVCSLDPASRLFKDVIIQLMMGGGKTTVIASLILKLVAGSRRIAFYIAPAAQIASLRQNLGVTQKRNFGQNLRVIDLTRADFSLKNLKWIHQQLQEAEAEEDPVLCRAEEIQALELEFLITADKLSKQMTPEALQVWEVLHAINLMIREKGVALWDEVDVLMNPNHATHLPVGEEQKIEPFHVDLIQAVSTLLLSRDIVVDGKTVAEITQLQKQESGVDLIPAQLFRNKVAPALAKRLAETFKPLYMHGHVDSFVRYVTGEMKRDKLTPADREFLQKVIELHRSLDEEEREAADLIVLAKRLFSSDNGVLSTTLRKKAGKDFSRSRTELSGKVVPFLGVDSPATTQFGDECEAAIYHFMTAARYGVTVHQVAHLAAVLQASANIVMEQAEIPFEETPDAQAFLLLTGIPLSHIHKEGNLEKATEYVNADLERTFSVEAETVCDQVSFYPEFISSNPQDFAGQFSEGRRVGTSGTPYNFPTYPKSLSQNLIREQGIDGRIADTMLTRAKENGLVVHTIASVSIPEIFRVCVQTHPQKERIRGIIDAAGLFRDFDNKTVAEHILSELKRIGSPIDTVLFFGRKSEDDNLPDDFMALREGMESPLFLGTPRAEVLKPLGITPERCFILYDDRHCEATDYTQTADAVNIQTVGGTNLRTVAQAALRMRNYLLRKKPGQDLIFVSTQRLSVEEALRQAIKIQAIQVAQGTFRAFQHKIRAAVRSTCFNHLLGLRKEEVPSFFSLYRDVFVTRRAPSLFDQYFEPELLTPPMALLESCQKQWLEKFQGKSADRDLLRSVTKATDEVLKEAAAATRFLPDLVPQPQGDTEETEVELEMAREEQVETNQNLDLDLDLQVELQRYNESTKKRDRAAFSEKPWIDEFVRDSNFPLFAWGDDKFFASPARVCTAPLSHLLERAPVQYAQPYHRVFGEQIFVTINWALTLNQFLPILHPWQKPAHQLLMICKEGKVSCLLVSIREAAFFLEREKPGQLWLVHPDGKGFSQHKYPYPPVIEAQVAEILLQVNFLNGHAEYLEKHPEETERFLTKGSRDLKIRFLKLMVEKDPKQKMILSRNPLFSAGAPRGHKTYLSKAQRDSVRLQRKKWTAETIKDIPPAQVRLIRDGALIPFLERKDQLDALRPTQVPFITARQVPLLSEGLLQYIPFNKPELLAAVPDDKLSYLQPVQIRHLPQEKVEVLPDDKLQYLRSNQVPWVQNGRLHLLPPSHIQWVSPQQVPHLADDRLHLLATKEQVAVIHPDKIPYNDMPSQHIPFLVDRQIGKLTRLDHIHALLPNQADHVNPAYIYQLHPEQQLPGLTDRERIKRVPVGYFRHLNNLQIQHINPEDVRHLPDPKIPALETPALIDAVDSHRVSLLEPRQVQHLTAPDKIAKVATNCLSSLKIEQTPHIPHARIHECPIEMVGRLAGWQKRYLTDTALQATPPNLVQHLLDDQLKHLQRQDQIDALDPARIRHLKTSQYPLITRVEQILAIPEENYSDLDKNQTRIRFGGLANAAYLALTGLVWLVIRVATFFLPLFTASYPAAHAFNARIISGMRGMPIALHIIEKYYS